MTSEFDQLLSSTHLAGLRAALAGYDEPVGMAQLRRLRDRASQLEAPADVLRLGIVHTYTSDLLDPWLQLAAALQGMSIDVYHAPFGMSLQEAQAESGLVRQRPM